MQSLIYKSAARIEFGESSLNDLAARATRKNQRLEITGILYYRYGDRTFLQYLEGPARAIEDLMASIRVDDRHTVERELWLDRDAQRLFPIWSMRRLTDYHLAGIRMEDVAAQVVDSLALGAYDEASAATRVLEIVRKIAEAAQPVEPTV